MTRPYSIDIQTWLAYPLLFAVLAFEDMIGAEINAKTVIREGDSNQNKRKSCSWYPNDTLTNYGTKSRCVDTGAFTSNVDTRGDVLLRNVKDNRQEKKKNYSRNTYNGKNSKGSKEKMIFHFLFTHLYREQIQFTINTVLQLVLFNTKHLNNSLCVLQITNENE